MTRVFCLVLLGSETSGSGRKCAGIRCRGTGSPCADAGATPWGFRGDLSSKSMDGELTNFNEKPNRLWFG